MRSTASLLLALLLVPAAARAQADSASEQGVGVTPDSPPSVMLAFYDTHLVRVPRDTVEKYESKLQRVSHMCQDSREALAGSARTASDLLRQHASRQVTAYELLDRLQSSADDPLNAQPRCDDLMASIVIGLGGERLDLPKPLILGKLPSNRGGGGSGGG